MEREVEEEIGVGVRAKFTLAGANEEGKKQPLSDQIVFAKEFEVHGWQAKLFLALFLLSQSLYVWAPFFSTLHFCGHFLHIVDSRQFRSMLQILLKRIWPRNENAITVPSIFLSPGWMSAFCCMVGGRENLFLLSQYWENQGFVSWQEGGTSSITKSFCHTMVSTLCVLTLPCAEGHKESFTYGYNREFQEEKLHQFWVCLRQEKLHNEKRQLILECTSITTMSMLSFCQLLPPRTVPWCDFWKAL